MLERVFKRQDEFEKTVDNYQAARRYFEKMLVEETNKPGLAAVNQVSREIIYKGKTFEVTVQMLGVQVTGNDDEAKYKALAGRTLQITLSNQTGNNKESIMIPSASYLVPDEIRDRDSLTIDQAKNILKSIRGIRTLLLAPKK